MVESLYKKINEKIVNSKKDKIVNTMISFTNALKKAGIDIKKKVFKEIYDNLGGNLRIVVCAAAPIDKNPEEIEMMIDKIDEVKESMVYGAKPSSDSKKEEKELIITARVLPDYDKIKELYGDITEEEIYTILWNKIKEVNKKLTSYKAVKALEIKQGEFEKTSTMKIKRYKELNQK